MKRGLGQHFLTSQQVLEEIVDSAGLREFDVVLEPGCGDGRLTRIIARYGCEVLAVEVDKGLAEVAKRELSGLTNVRLLVGNVLKLRPEGFNKVVGNPPYCISRRLLQWLIIERKPETIVLTLQREFAEKLLAKPGSDDYVYISILAQMFYEVSIKRHVARHLFMPPPRVSSCVVVMKRRSEVPDVSSSDLKVIKQLFTSKRRLLRTLLRKMYGDLIADLGDKRIYQMSPSEFVDLINNIREALSLNRASEKEIFTHES